MILFVFDAIVDDVVNDDVNVIDKTVNDIVVV